jgi:hypothetical protein
LLVVLLLLELIEISQKVVERKDQGTYQRKRKHQKTHTIYRPAKIVLRTDLQLRQISILSAKKNIWILRQEVTEE